MSGGNNGSNHLSEGLPSGKGGRGGGGGNGGRGRGRHGHVENTDETQFQNALNLFNQSVNQSNITIDGVIGESPERNAIMKTFFEFQRLSEHGHTASQFYTAIFLLQGYVVSAAGYHKITRGIKTDRTNAVKWLIKSSESHRDSLYLLIHEMVKDFEFHGTESSTVTKQRCEAVIGPIDGSQQINYEQDPFVALYLVRYLAGLEVLTRAVEFNVGVADTISKKKKKGKQKSSLIKSLPENDLEHRNIDLGRAYQALEQIYTLLRSSASNAGKENVATLQSDPLKKFGQFHHPTDFMRETYASLFIYCRNLLIACCECIIGDNDVNVIVHRLNTTIYGLPFNDVVLRLAKLYLASNSNLHTADTLLNILAKVGEASAIQTLQECTAMLVGTKGIGGDVHRSIQTLKTAVINNHDLYALYVLIYRTITDEEYRESLEEGDSVLIEEENVLNEQELQYLCRLTQQRIEQHSLGTMDPIASYYLAKILMKESTQYGEMFTGYGDKSKLLSSHTDPVTMNARIAGIQERKNRLDRAFDMLELSLDQIIKMKAQYKTKWSQYDDKINRPDKWSSIATPYEVQNAENILISRYFRVFLQCCQQLDACYNQLSKLKPTVHEDDAQQEKEKERMISIKWRLANLYHRQIRNEKYINDNRDRHREKVRRNKQDEELKSMVQSHRNAVAKYEELLNDYQYSRVYMPLAVLSQNEKTSVEYLLKAADSGIIEAWIYLAKRYMTNELVQDRMKGTPALKTMLEKFHTKSTVKSDYDEDYEEIMKLRENKTRISEQEEEEQRRREMRREHARGAVKAGSIGRSALGVSKGSTPSSVMRYMDQTSSYSSAYQPEVSVRSTSESFKKKSSSITTQSSSWFEPIPSGSSSSSSLYCPPSSSIPDIGRIHDHSKLCEICVQEMVFDLVSTHLDNCRIRRNKNDNIIQQQEIELNAKELIVGRGGEGSVIEAYLIPNTQMSKPKGTTTSTVRTTNMIPIALKALHTNNLQKVKDEMNKLMFLSHSNYFPKCLGHTMLSILPDDDDSKDGDLSQSQSVPMSVMSQSVSNTFSGRTTLEQQSSIASSSSLATVRGKQTKTFVVMELAPYGSLKTVLLNVRAAVDNQTMKPLPLSLLIKWMMEIALAIQDMHMVSLKHLDVKPDNILVFDGLHVKLSDLGLTKQHDHIEEEDSRESTIEGLDAEEDVRHREKMMAIASSMSSMSVTSFTGTRGYCAPETKQTLASDIFSFGMTCVHILHHRKYHEIGWMKEAARAKQLLVPELTAPSTASGSISVDKCIWGDEEFSLRQGLAELIENCLNRDPQSRPTASQCVTVLQDLYVTCHVQLDQNEMEGLERIISSL